VPKLLIIDDDPAFRGILSVFFRDKLGYECSTADSGAQGISFATEGKPDAILLDLRLKDMTGFDVLRRIRDDQRSAAIPVVIMTGESRSVDLLASAAATFKVSAFLQKSAALDAVRVEVERALGGGAGPDLSSVV
jgi:CheY-like chemotaxis protein